MNKKKVIIKDKKLCKRYNEKKRNKNFDYYWNIKKIIDLQTCLDSIAFNILHFKYISVDPVDSLTYYEKLTDEVIDKCDYLKNKYTFYRNLIPWLIIGIAVSFLIGMCIGYIIPS